MNSIRIIPLQPVSVDLILSIVHPLRTVFRAEVKVDAPLSHIVQKTYDDSRAQYNSTDLLRHMLDLQSKSDTMREGYTHAGTAAVTFPKDSKILGITSVDLFVPILTYVFGEAQLDGTAAVVSTFRLDNAIYGLEPDPILLFERTLKEAVHEIGHTFGLVHCRNLDCAMHASTAVEDIDVKGGGLCSACSAAIGVG